MGADLYETDLHLTVKNFLTQLPYVDASGLTTLNMPYESIDVTEVMYEPKVTEISTARIVLPSLIAEPGLRPLLQNIKEGDRVEIFNFQPDCGDPVFAGFIPSGGIEEQDGKTILNVEDTLGQLRWQHIRRTEYFNAPVSTLYDRAMKIWADQVNEDFLGATASADYLVTTTGAPVVSWGAGFVKVVGTGADAYCLIQSPSASGFAITPGDAYLFEGDFTFQTNFSGNSAARAGLLLGDPAYITTGFGAGAHLLYQNSFVGAFPQGRASDIQIFPPAGPNYDPLGFGFTSNQPSYPVPATHHLAVYLRFDQSTVTIYEYVDNINVAFTTQPYNYTASDYRFSLLFRLFLATDSVTCTNWRARKLTPALIRAGRFNPQTADAVTYQPNNEDNLQLLQLFAQKDNAEYRPIYHAWPAGTDELELDLVGTLGKHASAVLGYEQPPALPTEGSPQASPLPVITDLASFLIAPPFRFEEGFNLAAAPRIQPKANAHANDIIRMGASTQDAQVFAEKWAPSETGKPQHSPSGAQFPYFEAITNDDRVGIQSLNASLAGLDLIRGTDPTPSLELLVVEELPWAFRWRVGDFVWVKTLSLRNNIEQEMRVVKNVYKAGSPLRTVTLGKTDLDPSMMRMFAEDMKMSWLYEQSGTSPAIYVYPSLGSILSGASSPVFTIPLDQYTTGSALVYAALHWFADANVMNIAPVINGAPISLTGIVGASGTDSGLIPVTQSFQRLGTYQLSFKNNDAGTRSLTGAFLVLRLKG